MQSDDNFDFDLDFGSNSESEESNAGGDDMQLVDGLPREFNYGPREGSDYTKKDALKVIIFGIIFIAVTMFAEGITNKILNSPKDTVGTQGEISASVNPGDSSGNGGSTQGNNSQDNKQSEAVIPGGNSGNAESTYWQEISSTSIEFEGNSVKGLFTVQSIKHFARTVGNKNDMAVKTELEGNIKGINGDFIFDVPYSIGNQLQVGNEFMVEVETGLYNGNVVIYGEVRLVREGN